MTAPDTVTTVVDLESSPGDMKAHLACGVERTLPDVPVHALCGTPLLNIDAPVGHPNKCPECVQRMEAGGGPLASLLGILRCDQHRRLA